MVVAYCYAELITTRKPGGAYTYILDTSGPFIDLIRLWVECLIMPPCIVTIVAKYAVELMFQIEWSVFLGSSTVGKLD